MGLYLYGCYTPARNIQVQLPDGYKVEACLHRYICKPYRDAWDDDIVSLTGDRYNDEWGYAHKMTYMKVCKILKLWNGVNRPRFTMHVMDSGYLKEHGMSMANTGSLTLSTKDTPAVWLEENDGDINVGEYKRTRGGLWVMEPWTDGNKERYDKAREALTYDEIHGILSTGQEARI